MDLGLLKWFLIFVRVSLLVFRTSLPGSQEVLTSLSCCDWVESLRVCKGTRNLVRDYVSEVMDGLPPLPLGWTVPLDILRIRTNGQGKRVLLAPDYGVSIESPAGVPDEDVEGLAGILIPPPAGGFLTVGKQDYFACSPILRCTWKGMTPHPNVPWTVRCPIDEETGSCTTPGDVGVLHRSFESQEEEWQELRVEIRPESIRAGVEFEVPHFSDVVLAIRRATLSQHEAGYIKLRRPILSMMPWLSRVRQLWLSLDDESIEANVVRIINASPAELSFLQVPPSQVFVGRSSGLNADLPFVGGSAQRTTTYTPPARVQHVGTLRTWEIVDGEGREPSFHTLYPIAFTRSMRLVIFTMDAARTQFTVRDMINDCRVGTDVILLDGMQHKETIYGRRAIADGDSVVESLLEMLRSQV